MTSPQRPNNADGYFWAGTHVMDEVGPNAEGYCLDFGSRGPTMLETNGYTEIGNPGFDANVSRMLSYISGLVDENDADTPDNRDRAVAAAYAIWGLTDLSGLGFDNDSSFGNPDWGQLWINGAIGGDVEEWPADPGSNPAAIDAYYQQIKVAANSLLGGLPTFDAGPDVQFGPGQTSTPITPVVTVGGQPMPLIRVRVTSVTNLTGIAVGQEFTTNASGQLGGLVVGLANPTQPGSVTFEATLPGGAPRFWEAGQIDNLPAQMMVTKGAEQVVSGDIAIEPAELAIEIATTARDAADNDNVVIPGGQIIDNVQYAGLTPGASYTLNLTWMLGNGTPSGLTSTVTFTAPATDGNIDVGPVTVPFGLGGQTLVAFEQLVANPAGTVVAVHEDINDANQTVVVPPATVGTTARDVADGDNAVIPGGQIIDTISYTGLNPGTTYTANLTWMNQATGQSTGLTSSVQFTPATSSGTVDVGPVTVPFDMGGTTLVAFEQVLAPDGTIVGSHEDINDVPQTVTALVPEIGTTARDFADGDNQVLAGGQIIDTVSYENLNPGTTYTANLTWMNKTTGESTGLTSTVDFTPTTPTGTVDVGPVTVPMEALGSDLVAFEQVVAPDGTVVAVHEDINDVPQTVTVLTPEIGTTASDIADGDNEVTINGQIIDTVDYMNLSPGVEYTLSLVWTDKTTGESTKLGASVTFTPTTSSGSIKVGPVTVPVSAAGKTLVAFEELLTDVGGELTVVAEHKDINDVPQTVTVQTPEITTKIQGGDTLVWRTSTYDVATVTGFTGPGTTKFVGYRFTLDEWNNAERRIDDNGRAYRVLECSDDRVIAGSVSTTSFIGTGDVDEVRSQDWLVTGTAGAVVVTREFLYDDATGVEVANEGCGLEDQSFMTRRAGGEEIPETGIVVPQAPSAASADVPTIVSAQAFEITQPVAAEAANASIEAFEHNRMAAAERAGEVEPASFTAAATAPLRATPAAAVTVAAAESNGSNGITVLLLALLVLAGLGTVLIVIRKVRRAH